MSYPSALCEALRAQFAEPAPGRLLCVGQAARQLAEDCALPAPERVLAPADALDVTATRLGDSPVDIALLSQLPELERAQAGQLIAGLRDRGARQLMVLVQAPTGHWAHADMLSYGLTRRFRQPAEGAILALYEFSIATYKTTPDWLNPSNWANPQLWDKHRW